MTERRIFDPLSDVALETRMEGEGCPNPGKIRSEGTLTKVEVVREPAAVGEKPVAPLAINGPLL